MLFTDDSLGLANPPCFMVKIRSGLDASWEQGKRSAIMTRRCRVGETAVQEAHWLLGQMAQRNPIFAGDIEQQLIVRGGDQKLARMLELSGVPDIARAAWLSPVSDQGIVSWPVAQIGNLALGEVEQAIEAVNAVPGVFSEHPQSFSAPTDSDCVICPVGDRSVGRAALFLQKRHWSSAFAARVEEAIERVRQLVHMIWIIRGEVVEDAAPVAAADELAEHVPFGILIIDADQRVHLANGSARKLLARSQIFGLMGNRVVINQSTDAIRFQVALRGVLAQGGSRALLERRTRTITIEGGRDLPLMLTVSRLPADDGRDARACVIITRPGARGEPDIAALAEYYRLTPVESRVTRELVKGLSVQEVAQALQLKEPTVRTYLKQIFQKTSTHRQAELMQLMLNGALPVLD